MTVEEAEEPIDAIEDAAVPASEPQDEEGLEQVASAGFSLLLSIPAWLVSLVLHLGLLLVLAFWTLANEPEWKGFFISATADPTGEEFLESLDVELETLPTLEESQPWSLAAEVADPGEMAFADLGQVAAVDAQQEIGELAAVTTTIDEIGALFSKDGEGMTDIESGLKAAASFFGTKSKGRRFVFVVDNSNSMMKGRFETALNELSRTIEAMSPQQQFYIVFFSDSAYRMFHPNPAPSFVPATPQNKERVRSWLYTVQLCLRTQGEKAMTIALGLNPDVVYILGDGAFTDDTTEMLTAPHNRTIPIHTLGMEVDPVGERQLRAIAAANHGNYRAVEAQPEAQAMAKRNPMPRNWTRGPVWGLELPMVAGPKKKKR